MERLKSWLRGGTNTYDISDKQSKHKKVFLFDTEPLRMTIHQFYYEIELVTLQKLKTKLSADLHLHLSEYYKYVLWKNAA